MITIREKGSEGGAKVNMGFKAHRQAGLPIARRAENSAYKDTTTKFITDIAYLVICRIQKMVFWEWGLNYRLSFSGISSKTEKE